jgi:hypothetical protein
MKTIDCTSPSNPSTTFRSLAFHDGKREFIAYVVLGSDAADRQPQVVAILDSLRAT